MKFHSIEVLEICQIALRSMKGQQADDLGGLCCVLEEQTERV